MTDYFIIVYDLECNFNKRRERKLLDHSYYAKADQVIAYYGKKPASLIPIMQDIQAEYRYLPGELLTYVAE